MKFTLSILALLLASNSIAQEYNSTSHKDKERYSFLKLSSITNNNLNYIMANLQLEQTAPDFTLPTQHDNKLVKLSDFRGKNVVLYFYPKDNTPGCTIEAKEFNSLKEEFSKLNTVVFGVSKDDAKSHKNFANKCSLNFDLLSDVTGDVSQQYGVLVEKSMFGKKYMGLQRSTFLINTDGKIAYIWPKAGFMGHAKEVLEQVKKIAAIA